MKKNEIKLANVIAFMLEIVAITSIVISMFRNGDKFFLMFGLLCNVVALVLVYIFSKKNKRF